MLRGLGLKDLIILFPVLLLCMTIHEICHGYAAYLLGDKTAKHMGRLSPNPLKHVDWIGMIMLMTIGYGWAKPVPVNMYNFKDPKKGMALTALAGPFANILLAFLTALIYRLTYVFFPNVLANDIVYTIFSLMLSYNAVFAMFNLIPIPPLDGSKVLFALLPNNLYYRLMQFERYGMLIMIVLLYTGLVTPLLDTGITNLVNGIWRLVDFIIPM